MAVDAIRTDSKMDGKRRENMMISYCPAVKIRMWVCMIFLKMNEMYEGFISLKMG
jgi:hypothetical protein